MLTKPIVIIISQYIKSNHHSAHLKFTVIHVNYFSIKLGGEENKMLITPKNTFTATSRQL